MSAAKDIMAAVELANGSYKSGYSEGFKAGARAGIEAAQRIVAGDKPEDVLAELVSKQGMPE